MPAAAAQPVTSAAASVPPPPPVPAALSGQTGYLLRMAVAHAGRWIAATVPGGFPPRTQEILQALADLGPRSQRELADLLHINPPLMVGLIDAIERAGLLERRRNPADRRSYALEPTHDGLNALAELNTAIDRAEAGLTAPLSAAEVRRLGALLRTIIATDGWQPKLPEGLARRTGYLLESAHGHVRHLVDARLQAVDLTTTLYGPLATLAALGATSQQAIADRLGFTAAAIQQTVDRLEAARLVNRRRNPADRRAYALELTPAGRTLLRRAQRAVDQVNHQHLDHTLGGTEHNAELRETLRKLLHSPGNGRR
jgi:DNA-binding MarR family transcriptional regulator